MTPGAGRSPGGGNGNPLHYSCLENPMDRGAWWATVRGVEKSRTQLKRLSTQHTCADMCVCMCLCVYLCICTCVCVFICVFCVCLCTYICVRVCAQAHVGFYFSISSSPSWAPLCPASPIHCLPGRTTPSPRAASQSLQSGLLISPPTTWKAQQLAGEGRGR